MSRSLTALAAQVRPVPYDPAATFAKFEDEVNLARTVFSGADLVVFPELYLTGDDPFAPGAPDGFEASSAEPVPGPLTERIGKVAARARRWICAGSIFERGGGDAVYNTALVFSSDGHLVARYRKLFPWRPFEASTPGDAPPAVFEIPGVGRFGVMICYDGWFPEVARSIALAGGEVILHPTLTTTPDREQELVLARANAIANQLYVVNVNAVPSMGGGASIGVGPEGEVVFELGQNEEFALMTLDLDHVAHIRERGTRGLNRVLRHAEEGPRAAFEGYRRFFDAG
jgi:formamidase